MINKEKIKLTKKTDSNCMGTALFLSDLIGKDRFAYDHEIWQYINHHDYKTQPSNEYFIAIWFNKKIVHYNTNGRTDINCIEHMGVVTNITPILITHRTGFLESLIENQPIDEITPNSNDIKSKEYTYVRYYSPKI